MSIQDDFVPIYETEREDPIPSYPPLIFESRPFENDLITPPMSPVTFSDLEMSDDDQSEYEDDDPGLNFLITEECLDKDLPQEVSDFRDAIVGLMTIADKCPKIDARKIHRPPTVRPKTVNFASKNHKTCRFVARRRITRITASK